MVVGKDVATALGYKDSSDALKKHVDTEEKLTRRFADSGQNREMYIINESGLYSLILSSKLESAKKFKKWITSEVLPSIRKTGMYATDALIDRIIEDPDFGIELLSNLKKSREENKKLQAKIKQDEPKVLFAEAVETSYTSILIGDLAKILKQNGIETGQKRLFEKLRQEGYLMTVGESRNMPTQKSMELGLFEIKERTIDNPDGSVRITRTTKVTGAGQRYFINKFLNKNI